MRLLAVHGRRMQCAALVSCVACTSAVWSQGPCGASRLETPACLACHSRRRNERPDAELANQKWGWIATVPGSWAELEVDTTSELQASSSYSLPLVAACCAV